MKKILQGSTAILATVLIGGFASAQVGPDVTVCTVGVDINTGNSNDIVHWGENPAGDIRAYNFATQSYNNGNQLLSWQSGNHNHPVIGQNIYRLKDGRFEMMGQSFLKHGFCAVNEPTCGSCSGTSCSTLGIGCSDTYWATLNDGATGGAKSDINPTTGFHNTLTPDSGAGGTARGRLQVIETEIDPAQNAGASYFIEGQYVAADDAAAGNGLNNCSWRPVNVLSLTNIDGAGPTRTQQPAIFAWRDADPSVSLFKAINFDEGGMGMHGQYWVGVRTSDNGDGTWHYEYALYNQTSNRGAGGFRVPLGAGATVVNDGMRLPRYHSGEIYNTPDWAMSRGATEVSFATTTPADPLETVVRWGTLANFWFDSSAAPVVGTVSVDMHDAGSPASLNVPGVPVPGVAEPGSVACLGDGTGAACPCGNNGAPGEGCATTTGAGMTIAGSGSTSISADDLTMTAMGVPLGNTGIFYSGTAIQAGASLFDGIQCAIGSTFRFSGQVANTSTVSDTGFVAQDTFGLYWNAGTTYHFHYFSRDNQAGPSPCGGFANLSPVYSVTMTP